MEIDRRHLLAQVASWYYVDGDSLATIARRLERSVSRASRLLQEARDENLVDIRIRYPLDNDSKLARAIETRYGVSRVTVFRDAVDANRSRSLEHFGVRAANVLESNLTSGQSIAVGWGVHVHAAIDGIGQRKLEKGLVVQACGAVGAADISVDGARLAHMLADRLGIQSRCLHSPLILDSPSVANALRSSPSIKETLKAAQSATLTLMGLGSPEAAHSGMYKAGFVSRKELQTLRKQGSVGEIGGYHLTARGEPLKQPFNERVVGLTPNQLRQMANVVIIATGLEKVPAMHAALTGRYANHLITDQPSAIRLLELTDEVNHAKVH